MGIEDSPFMRRAAKRGCTGHGNLSEKKVGKSLGARMQPASGAMRSAKGDMKLGEEWLGEAKSTINDTLKLDLGFLNKIMVEALAIGRKPFLTMTFVTSDGNPRRSGEWVAVPAETFRSMLGELGDRKF